MRPCRGQWRRAAGLARRARARHSARWKCGPCVLRLRAPRSAQDEERRTSMSGKYVVEDKAKLTFSVSREALVAPEILERERRAVFDTCWIYVGHGSEVPEPGDFKSRDIAGRPVIFCRDHGGAVRCLLNSCRH